MTLWPAASLLALVLVAVLVTSAVAKWRDLSSTQAVITLLRLPLVLRAGWVARALPVGEGLLALGLLAPVTWVARPAALGAVLLLLVYWVVIARALTFDPRPSCGCFGRIGDQRVTPRTLVRNTLLVLPSACWLSAAWSGATVPRVLADFSVVELGWVAAAFVTAVLGVLILGGSGSAQAAPVVVYPDGTVTTATGASGESDPQEYVRVPVPDLALLRPDGSPVLLSELTAQAAQLLIFLSPTCGPCTEVATSVPLWASRLAPVEITVALPVQPGRVAEIWPALAPYAVVDPAGVGQRAFGGATPTAVLLGTDGLLAGGPVSGLGHIEGFVEEIIEHLRGADLG